ncbi:MAG: FAD-binding protein [Chloroflexi bacterium]|nr:MAG: FAD-binding protein [Chloroflexota bacterium]MBL1194691.1 FAD-binding protein [Chloroflexota bacterium]NOH11983.1 NAD(P)-binding protein [Chloroflexota bacterium]
MKRREFLKLSAIAILASACNAITSLGVEENQEDATDMDSILIIGAGMAGLAAGRQLQDSGHTVTILEGRNRIGGRVWTSRKWEDIPVDMGASWIHGVRGNPITELANQAGVKRVETDYDDLILYNTDGQEASDALQAEMERTINALYSAVEDEAEEGMTLLESIETTDMWAELSETEKKQVWHFLSTSVEQEFAGGIDELSGVNFDDADEFGGHDEVFPDGYGRIAEFLAKGLSIEREQIVEEVSYRDDGVSIRTSQGTFKGDRVIVTLPIGVLQNGNVKFVPDLPRGKQDAINTMGAGLLDKLYLRFPEVFWPQDREFLAWISSEPGRWNGWLNMAAYTGQPVLLGFNAAEFARKIDGWEDAEIVEDAMSVLRGIYGQSIPEPEDWQISRWALDPFAYCSYSFNAVGADIDTRRTLAKPIGERVFFAGEATSEEYPSTVHGAYLSGLRAASNIMDL